MQAGRRARREAGTRGAVQASLPGHDPYGDLPSGSTQAQLHVCMHVHLPVRRTLEGRLPPRRAERHRRLPMGNTAAAPQEIQVSTCAVTRGGGTTQPDGPTTTRWATCWSPWRGCRPPPDSVGCPTASPSSTEDGERPEDREQVRQAPQRQRQGERRTGYRCQRSAAAGAAR
jgi:hypothetical protein